jgi:hypothetical protein
VTHAQLIKVAEAWLRQRRCRIVLSEQTAHSGEVPDVIGWEADCRSIVIECKISRADFFADQKKCIRLRPALGMGCQRYYLTPKSMILPEELPPGWGLLEVHGRQVLQSVRADFKKRRVDAGVLAEMELLLASLRRVEVRIEPQTITEFLKWKNRMAEYNGGRLPGDLLPEACRHTGRRTPTRKGCIAFLVSPC